MTTDYRRIYDRFHAPSAVLDCGLKCAPYNERGAPFCCDTRHCVPSVYAAEWNYLQQQTDLWHLFQTQTKQAEELLKKLPDGQVLVECLGFQECQRNFRSISCRTFPFFPYITRQGEFIGMSYYWDFEDRCWLISNLHQVSAQYRQEFIATFDEIFWEIPQERASFHYQSILMRRVFGRQHRAIPLLHRNGKDYKITPRNGRLRRVYSQFFPMFGMYKIAQALPFPGEE